MVRAYIALGANLGDAAGELKRAVAAVNTLPDCAVKKTSSFYQTASQEILPEHAPGDDYINAVIELETKLPAPILLQNLLQLELAAGRERLYINAPRTLDLDLLLYGSACIDSAHLTVPHPRMWQRAFVLIPLAEIAPHRVNATQLDAVKLQKIRKLSTSSIRPQEYTP